MMKELLLDNQEVTEKICSFLIAEFRERNKTRAVVGVSGGVDSAVVASLCKRAGLTLCAVSLPYGKLSKPEKVRKMVNFEIDITKIVDREAEEIGKHISLDKIDKGNLMARTRMMILYALARKLNGLVVGTENLSEYYLGYFTLHGDQACDINPIGKLFKTQIMELAKFLGLPQAPPSAELYEGQTDEGELGFSYLKADPILYLSFIRKYPKEKIIQECRFNADLVNRVLQRVGDTEYKRKPVPAINFYEEN